jgi:hypothetical protein
MDANEEKTAKEKPEEDASNEKKKADSCSGVKRLWRFIKNKLQCVVVTCKRLVGFQTDEKYKEYLKDLKKYWDLSSYPPVREVTHVNLLTASAEGETPKPPPTTPAADASATKPAEGPNAEFIPAQKGRFIIFIDQNYHLHYKWDGAPLPQDTFVLIANALHVATGCDDYLYRAQRLEFKRTLAQAIYFALLGQKEISKKHAQKAKEFLEKRLIECSRFWTLDFATKAAGGTSLILLFGVLLLSWFYKRDILSFQSYSFFFHAAFGGLLGAYLSVIQKASAKREYDASARHGIHSLEAGCGIVAGVLFGITALATLQAGILEKIFAADWLVPGKNNPAFIFFLGFVAGWGERFFVPKIVSKFETKMPK